MRLTILVGTFLADLLDDHAAAGVELVEVGPLVRGHAPSSVLIDAPQARVQVPATVITLTRTAGCDEMLLLQSSTFNAPRPTLGY